MFFVIIDIVVIEGVFKMKKKIIIVGGGAAGMMAAILARRNGGHVTILERNDRVGKKLLATGNGRCNYTNRYLSLGNYHGNDKEFIKKVLDSFTVDDSLDFFEQLGITPSIEDDGKVFPLSYQSSSMLDVLRHEMEHLGVELITGAQVVGINKQDMFYVKLKDNSILNCHKLVLATGGMAMPASGSDGIGHRLAKELGHTITDVFPALVQLKLKGDMLKQVKGVKVLGSVGIYKNDKLLREDKGDVLFTDYGISGPPILQISRKAIEEDYKDVELRVSLIDGKSSEEVRDYLIKRFSIMGHKKIADALIGFINKRLILPILKELNINKDTRVSHLSMEDIEKLAHIFTDWRFEVIGNNGWGQAQTTAGGVLTVEIDSSTMESKKVKGLYIVGELLDVDGDCGGFNLQWAWSTGYLAGNGASN